MENKFNGTRICSAVCLVCLELQAWDVTSACCNLNEQLEIIGSQQPEIKTGTVGKTYH